MRNITSVSFPRSGHHLLINILARYFGKDPLYDSRSIETGEDRSHFTAGRLVYCEYYTHCRKSPCSDPKTTFQKNHDFDLKLPNKNGQYYIVQYRNPKDAIASNFKLESQVLKTVEDSEASWKKYHKEKMIYWESFYKKWVLQNKNPLTYYVKYEDLVTQPGKVVRGVMQFCDPDSLLDKERLKEAIASV